MSFESQITQQVANLTNRLNTITTQAKKIFQLPPQTPLNPASEIHVTIGGISQKINVQQIVDAILSFRQNQLVAIGTIAVSGNDLTVPANAQWIINNINYFNPADIVINVPYAADGYTRTDILVADTNNDIIRIVGPETEGISPTPNVPLNTVLVTTISVTDSTIGNTPPVIGTDFEVLINKQNSLVADGTGTKYPTIDAINAADFLQNLQRVLELGATAEDVGIQLTSSTESSTINLDNEGIIVDNEGVKVTVLASDITAENSNESLKYLSNALTHTDNTTGGITKLWLTRITTGFSQFFLPNKTGSHELATTSDLDLKLNISDYNDRFKGVFLTEAALNIAFPTASAGDYAQVNETGSTKVVNYNWDAEDGSWVEGGSGGSGATNTDMLPEGSSNLYFTSARVLSTVLSGISFATGGPITSTDSILVAFGKIQKQITDVIASITLKQDILTDVNFGTFINGLTAKTTPIDADSISIVDSADSNKQKKVSLTNFKAYLKTYFDTLYQAVLVSGTNIKTYAGVSILGSGDIPVQATITTATSITTATTTTGSYAQHGKNIIIDNGANAINYIINAAITASFVKHGTGAITFVQGSGRTMIQVDGTAILNGAVGSTATISSVGTTDYLRISNA